MLDRIALQERGRANPERWSDLAALAIDQVVYQHLLDSALLSAVEGQHKRIPAHYLVRGSGHNPRGFGRAGGGVEPLAQRRERHAALLSQPGRGDVEQDAL